MSDLLQAVVAGAEPEELLSIDLPSSYKATHLLKEEVGIFEGETDKDVRKSLHVGEIAMPELAPDECLVAVMSAAINFNTVWSAIFEPIPTFAFLEKFGRQDWHGRRHDLPYHQLGSDGSGVVVRVGAGIKKWKVGDKVVISTAYVDEEDHASYDDGMMTETQLAWGFETNFGSLGEFCLAKANQLIKKPTHLSWEESASSTLCAATAYRMLVGKHGAEMKQGDVVLVDGLPARVRQPLPVDAAQAHHRFARLQLPRGRRDQPADQPRNDPADAVQGLSPGRRRRGDPGRPDQPARRQGRRPVRSAVREPRDRRPRASRQDR